MLYADNENIHTVWSAPLLLSVNFLNNILDFISETL